MTTSVPQEVPVVVVGGKIGGLGMVRSLRAGRMPIYVVDTSRWRPAMQSSGVRPVPVASMQNPLLVTALLRLRHEMSAAPVLLLADEAAVFAVSEHRATLSDGFRFALPSEQTVGSLLDKGKFQVLSERICLPVPRSLVVESEADLRGLRDMRYPVAVKPVDKRDVQAGLVRRIGYVRTIEEARRMCADALVRKRRLLVQEWVEGPDEQIYFCLFYADANGQILTAFSGRKLWSYPPRLGSTGVCVAAPDVHQRLLGWTRRLIEAVSFIGLGSVEFKWDSKGREFVVIEPTVGRVDQQEEIATLCGKNIPLVAYKDALGRAVDPDLDCSNAPRDLVWRESAVFFDRRYSGRALYDGFWRRDDPLPALFYYFVNVPSVAWRFLMAYGVTKYFERVSDLFGRALQYQSLWRRFQRSGRL